MGRLKKIIRGWRGRELVAWAPRIARLSGGFDQDTEEPGIDSWKSCHRGVIEGSIRKV